MDRDKQSPSRADSVMGQTIEQARGAMESYLKLFQNNLGSAPWAGTELNTKVMKCAEHNITSAFDYAQKITQAKTLQEVAAIQTEFFQSQLRSLTEQAKDVQEIATTAAVNSFKLPTDKAS